MASGGYRPGAGRPKGSGVKRTTKPVEAALEITVPTTSERRTPLEYMLDVMNDPGADESRRDRMAIAAAPYTHAKKADDAGGKKAQRQEAAKKAASGRFAPPAAPKLVVNNH